MTYAIQIILSLGAQNISVQTFPWSYVRVRGHSLVLFRMLITVTNRTCKGASGRTSNVPNESTNFFNNGFPIFSFDYIQELADLKIFRSNLSTKATHMQVIFSFTSFNIFFYCTKDTAQSDCSIPIHRGSIFRDIFREKWNGMFFNIFKCEILLTK